MTASLEENKHVGREQLNNLTFTQLNEKLSNGRMIKLILCFMERQHQQVKSCQRAIIHSVTRRQ